MQATIHQIVTFATDVFSGNPAFVVTIPHPVRDDILQKVAGQLGEAVLSCLRRVGDDRFELIFYSPLGRHGGAGHAAAAASHVVLVETGGERGTFVLADGSERTIVRQGSRTSVPWPVMPYEPTGVAGTLSEALGIPVARALVSDFGYIAICEGPGPIRTMRPDLDAIARLDRGTVIVTAPGETSDIVIRVFAPKLGLPEDPVCGTAHRIIVPYWSEQLGRTELHSHQLSPRGGDLWCRLDGETVVISGECKTFLTGILHLPEFVSPTVPTTPARPARSGA
jgi:predicted PhzF superfamily epimerase YddE/YHI9